jgi:hypothetical protein
LRLVVGRAVARPGCLPPWVTELSLRQSPRRLTFLARESWADRPALVAGLAGWLRAGAERYAVGEFGPPPAVP